MGPFWIHRLLEKAKSAYSYRKSVSVVKVGEMGAAVAAALTLFAESIPTRLCESFQKYCATENSKITPKLA